MHAGLRDSFHCRAVYVTHCTPVRLQCSQGRYGDTDVYAGILKGTMETASVLGF